MSTTVTTLHEDFKKHFGISEVHWSKDSSAQKFVHSVTRNGNKCILKIYKNFNERDVREIEIYKKFENVPDIPKLIEIAKYGKDTISFEKLIEGNCLEDVVGNYIANDALV